MKRVFTLIIVLVITIVMFTCAVYADEVVINVNNDREMVVGEPLGINGLYHSGNIGWYALNVEEISVPEKHPSFAGKWIEVPAEDTNLLLNGFSTYSIVCVRLKAGQQFNVGTWNEARDVVVSFDKLMISNDYSFKYYVLIYRDDKLSLEEIPEEQQFLFSIMRQDFTRPESEYTSYLVHPDNGLSYIKFAKLERIVEDYRKLNVGNSILFILHKAGIDIE